MERVAKCEIYLFVHKRYATLANWMAVFSSTLSFCGCTDCLALFLWADFRIYIWGIEWCFNNRKIILFLSFEIIRIWLNAWISAHCQADAQTKAHFVSMRSDIWTSHWDQRIAFKTAFEIHFVVYIWHEVFVMHSIQWFGSCNFLIDFLSFVCSFVDWCVHACALLREGCLTWHVSHASHPKSR